MANRQYKIPKIDFNGKISVVEHEDEIEAALQELEGEEFIGFDMEWKPNQSPTDNHKIALIQLSSATVCVLFRMLKMGGMPQKLKDILCSESVTKIGHTVNESDAIRLWEEYGIVLNRIVDVKDLASQMGFYPLGLKPLTYQILGFHLDKSLAMSDWSSELTPEQIQYAATDAWVTREIFLRLSPPKKPALQCRTCLRYYKNKKELDQHLRVSNHFVFRQKRKKYLQWSSSLANSQMNMMCGTNPTEMMYNNLQHSQMRSNMYQDANPMSSIMNELGNPIIHGMISSECTL